MYSPLPVMPAIFPVPPTMVVFPLAAAPHERADQSEDGEQRDERDRDHDPKTFRSHGLLLVGAARGAAAVPSGRRGAGRRGSRDV